MKKSFSGLALLLVLSTNVNAGDYTVQVGAYKSLSEHAIEQAQVHGEVFQRRGYDNLERLYVGRFNSRSDANNMRDTLRSSGFNGAFITNLDSSSITTSAGNHSFAAQDNLIQNTNFQSNKNYSIDDLNADERLKASYLDGQLRILSEGNFYTVEQYRQQNQF